MTWMTCPLCWSTPCICSFQPGIPFVPYQPVVFPTFPAPADQTEPPLTDDELRALRRLLKSKKGKRR